MVVSVHPIKTQEDLAKAIERAYALRHAPKGSQDEDEYLVLLDLIEAYEARRHPASAASPIELVTFMREQKGRLQADARVWVLPVSNPAEHAAATDYLKNLMELPTANDHAVEIRVQAILIEAYERIHFPIHPVGA